MTLTDNEYHFIVHCLDVAADVFVQDANSMHAAARLTRDPLIRDASQRAAAEFEQYVKQARELRVRIAERE